ncbi:unnamed protein product [Closterium sp. Naga37s-1]|nr:unnamed protein product [Closterium sp. Naga37s-1]
METQQQSMGTQQEAEGEAEESPAPAPAPEFSLPQRQQQEQKPPAVLSFQDVAIAAVRGTGLVSHHLHSFNRFLRRLPRIVAGHRPVQIHIPLKVSDTVAPANPRNHNLESVTSRVVGVGVRIFLQDASFTRPLVHPAGVENLGDTAGGAAAAAAAAAAPGTSSLAGSGADFNEDEDVKMGDEEEEDRGGKIGRKRRKEKKRSGRKGKGKEAEEGVGGLRPDSLPGHRFPQPGVGILRESSPLYPSQARREHRTYSGDLRGSVRVQVFEVVERGRYEQPSPEAIRQAEMRHQKQQRREQRRRKQAEQRGSLKTGK